MLEKTERFIREGDMFIMPDKGWWHLITEVHHVLENGVMCTSFSSCLEFSKIKRMARPSDWEAAGWTFIPGEQL